MLSIKIFAVLLLLLAAAAGFQLARFFSDQRAADRAWEQLLQSPAALPQRFDPAMVSELPEPARRFFAHAIRPGAPLGSVVEIRMEGELSLGTKDDPKYQPMTATQVLAAPSGFVWRLEAGQGAMKIRGSDGMQGDVAWTRFWLLHLVPVARIEGHTDLLRSAFGRLVAESAIWAPAFLLPRRGVTWAAVDADTARVTVAHGDLRQDVDIRVDGRGQPRWVSIPRWTDANPDKVFRVQPFGGELGDFREVSGYRLPFRVEGGNFFGTPDYFPFYRARVQDIVVR